MVVLAFALAVGGVQYRRALVSARDRSLGAANAAARELFRQYQDRMNAAVWRGMLEALVPAFSPEMGDLSATARAMLRREAEWQAGCGCVSLRPSLYVVFDVNGERMGVAGDTVHQPLSPDAIATLRDYAANADDDVRRLHAVRIGTGAGAMLAHLRVVRDARGARVGAAGLASVDALGATLLDPVWRELLGALPPAIPQRDSLASLVVTLQDGTRVHATSGVGPGVSVSGGLWAADDSVVRGTLTLNPRFISHLVPGGIVDPPDALLALAAVLLVVLVAATLVMLEHARRLMLARTMFLTAVSHELRTPLTQVMLYAEMLDRPDLDAQRRDRVRTVIMRESRRLIHMVENVLTFARTGAGPLPLNPRRTVLAESVRDILDDLGPLAERHGATIRSALDPALIARVDSGALRQILVNLVDNALRYGPRGQDIMVTVSVDGEHACLTVCDQGTGIPAASRAAAWAPFVRVGSVGEGAGIGLALVRSLATAMGGSARFAEQARGGAGLCVEVRLPRVTPEAVPATVERAMEAAL